MTAPERIWAHPTDDAYLVAMPHETDGTEYVRADLIPAAALAVPEVAVTWHPFDSAPRDGSRFLAKGGGLDAIDICSYNARVGCWNCGEVTLDDTDHEPEGYNRPTLWMPLAALRGEGGK